MPTKTRKTAAKAKKPEAKLVGKRKLPTKAKESKKNDEPKSKLKTKLERKSKKSSKSEPSETPAPKKGAAGKKAAGAKGTARLSMDKLRSIVDPQVAGGMMYHVYDDGKKVYHASLMWTDLKHNNNKFYIIQILADNANSNSFTVFNRWGRVGATGQFAQFPFSNAAAAVSAYGKKYREKTSKGYTEIHMAFEEDIDEPKSKKKKTEEKAAGTKKCKLDARIQKLVNLIFNMKFMSEIMSKRGFDTKKMPLGKLSKYTLEAGHNVLLKIEDVLNGKKKGDLSELSSEFYTLIPHDFGFQQMSQFVINTKDKLKEKMETLESLGDLEFANSLLKKGDSAVEANYSKLNAKIVPLEKTSDEYKTVAEYFKNTCDSQKITLEELYKIERKGEETHFKKKAGNEFLLWHGSPITNMVSILSGGLKVRCKELPWLSDRIFHADMIAKSIGYTGYYSSNNTAMALLDRVALGNKIKYCSGGFGVWSPPPKGNSSIVLAGHRAPPKSSYVDYKGMTIPSGKPSQGANGWYSEYVVWDSAQVKMEYITILKVN